MGVSKSAVGRWESGTDEPTWTELQQILRLADLALCLESSVPRSADLALVRHLRLSLTQRLRLALGESPAVWAPANGDVWRDLLVLSAAGTVELATPVAYALWLPTGRQEEVTVTVHEFDGAPDRLQDLAANVRVSPGQPTAPLSLVPVTLQDVRRVWVRPPLEVISTGSRDQQLREADRLLQEGAATDDRGRRRPAHRDPEEWSEHGRLLRTKGADPWAVDPRLSRAWRLGAAASLAQRLRER